MLLARTSSASLFAISNKPKLFIFSLLQSESIRRPPLVREHTLCHEFLETLLLLVAWAQWVLRWRVIGRAASLLLVDGCCSCCLLWVVRRLGHTRGIQRRSLLLDGVFVVIKNEFFKVEVVWVAAKRDETISHERADTAATLGICAWYWRLSALKLRWHIRITDCQIRTSTGRTNKLWKWVGASIHKRIGVGRPSEGRLSELAFGLRFIALWINRVSYSYRYQLLLTAIWSWKPEWCHVRAGWERLVLWVIGGDHKHIIIWGTDHKVSSDATVFFAFKQINDATGKRLTDLAAGRWSSTYPRGHPSTRSLMRIVKSERVWRGRHRIAAPCDAVYTATGVFIGRTGSAHYKKVHRRFYYIWFMVLKFRMCRLEDHFGAPLGLVNWRLERVVVVASFIVTYR